MILLPTRRREGPRWGPFFVRGGVSWRVTSNHGGKQEHFLDMRVPSVGLEPKTRDIPINANDGFQNMDAPRNLADLCLIDA